MAEFVFLSIARVCACSTVTEEWQEIKPPWPNGQGVGLLIRRLWVRVPQGVDVQRVCGALLFGAHRRSFALFGVLWRSFALFGALWRSEGFWGSLWRLLVLWALCCRSLAPSVLDPGSHLSPSPHREELLMEVARNLDLWTTRSFWRRSLHFLALSGDFFSGAIWRSLAKPRLPKHF